MAENKLIIPISLSGRNVELYLFGEKSGEILTEKSDAIENGESPFQIKEGYNYEYKITPGYSLEPSEIVSQSKVNDSSGRISPNIYVGTLTIDVLDPDKNKCGEVKLEVQSVKITYRQDYRYMLEEITEKCTDLLLQHSSPVSQYFDVDFNADSKILYQRFAFIKSILDSIEFNDAVLKIISEPVTRWKESEFIMDIRNVNRFGNSAIRQLASTNNRIYLPDDHPLKSKIQSVPLKIKISNKTETVDTPENRFIKHALVSIQSFCSDFKTKSNESARINKEAGLLIDKLEQFLSHSIFKEISIPTTLPLNSPVLQRKEGYRDILRVWLMFDLAAKMVWHGGDDIYSGNKRDVAVLYEYWLFFKLLDIIKEVFKIESLSIDKLIEQTSDGFGLKLKQGKFLPVEGVFINDTRKLRIEFSYNKTFSGDGEYPDGGSWTRNLRPDYTLSIWPFGIEQDQAEREELIVHVHFDAKYKIENIQAIFGKDDNLDEEKEEQKKGTYKRADLLKMHTYKDAIRRTAGAYVLYPGFQDRYTKTGFHELIPGLGAFAIRPSKSNNGTEELKKFLYEIVAHFMNRASQREKSAFRTYDIYKDRSIGEVTELLPETFGPNRDLIPDDTFVLIAYYKGQDHFNWINEHHLYNARTDSGRGSLHLSSKEAGVRYLLLHSENETTTGHLYKLKHNGPRIFSKDELIEILYPNPTHNFYLVFETENEPEKEFIGMSWDITKLQKYSKFRGSPLPFSVSLTELMKVLI
jgi:predicted component of viral defense system (DUF524 family)